MYGLEQLGQSGPYQPWFQMEQVLQSARTSLQRTHTGSLETSRKKKWSIGSICEYMLASFTLRPPRLSAAKSQPLGSPSGSSLLHSSPTALVEASELSPLCYQMVNVPWSFFLFLKIMCHQSCVIPMSKTPGRFLSPFSIRPLCSGHTAPVPSVALFPMALSVLALH